MTMSSRYENGSERFFGYFAEQTTIHVHEIIFRLSYRKRTTGGTNCENLEGEQPLSHRRHETHGKR